MNKKHLTNHRFTDFDLDDPLMSGLAGAGFEFCTPIQAASLPIALEGKDVAGQAQTGTGKTIAFLLACSHHLLRQPSDPDRQPSHVRALILAPTRELAIQIHRDAEILLKDTQLSIGLVYGGTKYDAQKSQLQSGVDLLIGTPGRLIDLYRQNLFGLKLAQVLVIDEADRMFDLGFIRDIRFLIRRMPPPNERLNLLYSATLSYKVMELAYEHMNDPIEIKMDDEIRVAAGIEEQCYCPSTEEKPVLLVNMLKRYEPTRALVFANMRVTVDRVSRLLKQNGISQGILAGHASQDSREKQLSRFKKGDINVLVATDVAARGLHIPEVSHVFNYDLPQDPENYIHRVGRTARAGLQGMAISYLCDQYAFSIEGIESLIGHELPKLDIQSWMLEEIESSPRETSDSTRKARKPRPGTVPPQTTETKTESVPAAAQQQDTPAPDSGETRTEKPEPPFAETPDHSAKSPASRTDSATRQSERTPFKPPKNRFSERFGEIPMIG